jgi:torulene dioxygenase
MEVWYNSRRANDKLIESVKKTGKYGYVSFGQRVDPCIGVFGKVCIQVLATKQILTNENR